MAPYRSHLQTKVLQSADNKIMHTRCSRTRVGLEVYRTVPNRMRYRSVPKRHHFGTLRAQFDPLRPLCCRLATSDPLGTPPNSLPRLVTSPNRRPGIRTRDRQAAVQRENQCATCTKCMKICGFDWLMMSGHHDGMNGHTHMVRVIHSWRGSLRPPPPHGTLRNT